MNSIEFIVNPFPGLVYRTIGGILDFYIFLGPTPENTVQQYTEVTVFCLSSKTVNSD
jgi:hypothetical protein